MRRAIAIAAAGLSLAGCSSFSLDAFKPAPPTVQVQLEFDSAGSRRPDLGWSRLQDALLGRSDGPRHRVLRDLHLEQVPAGHRPGAAVHGDLTSPAAVNPNPVVAELQPAGPPPKPVRKRVMKPRKPKPPKSAPAPAAGSPFPDQEQAPAAAAPPPAAAPAPQPGR